MKLTEMADLLAGLADSLENFMGKNALTDLRAVSECLRQFPDDSVRSFCSLVERTRENGRNSSPRPKRKSEPVNLEAQIQESTDKIRHFLDHRSEYDYADINRIVAQVKKLRKGAIESIANNVDCPVFGTKAQMATQLEDWLLNIRRSAHQSAFA